MPRSNDLLLLAVVLAVIALLLATTLETWLALRLPLWGDELDTITPAFRNWRGGKSFWWQIGQFNACPPGDPLVLRGLHRWTGLGWLESLSPELFWRLPYLMAFGLAAPLAFFGAWRWTRSALIGFLAFAFTLSSRGLLIYATETRFYAWLAFFMTACVWLFMRVAEEPRSRSFYVLSLTAALGVCFHLMLGAVAYFLMLFAIFWCAVDIAGMWRGRKRGRFPYQRALSAFLYLFAGALPFILYKVALKHWVFIPPPWAGISPWEKLRAADINSTFLYNIMVNLPAFIPANHWLVWLAALVTAATALAVTRRNPARIAQGLFLGMLLVASPIALYLSAAARNYGMMGRHFIYQIPVTACCAVFLWKTLADLVSPERLVERRAWLRRGAAPLAAAVMLTVFSNTVATLFEFASSHRETIPSKVTYPLVAWREFYRRLPARRELVVVGARPDQYDALTDFGNFKAGILRFYTREFSPVFYTSKGTFGADEAAAPGLAGRIEREPALYDFLLFDEQARLRKLFPRLPWSSWKCHVYRKDSGPLSFCRA